MILTKTEIIENIKSCKITIDPFELSSLNPNTYNFRLGEQYMLLNENKLLNIPEDGLTLIPNQLYLMTTYENIGSSDFVTLLNGRSSLGRLGVYVNADADLGHKGCLARWTLEVSCVQPVKIYPLMKFGQVSFWHTKGDTTSYTGIYNKRVVPFQSKFKTNDTYR